MSTNNWWSPELQEKLSQGDIIKSVPFGIVASPSRYLKKMKNTLAGGSTGWIEVVDPDLDSQGKITFLAKGRINNVMVVAHNCDLDKSSRVLVAPVFDIETIQPGHRQSILEQGTIYHMGLYEVPELGTSYADFRLISSIPRPVIDSLERVASMSEDSNLLLQARLVEFFSRDVIPKDDSESVAE